MIRLQTMRWLDDVLGAAVCFVLARLGGGGRGGGDERGRALFVGLAEMGNVVLADPAMRRARDTHGVEPYFVIFEQNRESLALTGTVRAENIFRLRTRSLPALAADTLRFMVWARRQRIAVAIDTDPCSNFSTILTRLSGAVRCAGFHGTHAMDSRARLYNRGVAYRPDRHQAQNLVALTDAALAAAPDAAASAAPLPRIARRHVSAPERQAMQARLRLLAADFEPAHQRLLLVNASLGDLLPQRRWPRENYARLIDALLERREDLFVLLLGTAADADAAAALETEIGNRRCRAVAGAFALAELPALFACSDLLLSSDAGPAHFAAVTALPVVVLFGPETPTRYRPLGNATALTAGIECSPCINPETRRRTDCADNRCMRAISVATVMAEVERRLDETGARTDGEVRRAAAAA